MPDREDSLYGNLEDAEHDCGPGCDHFARPPAGPEGDPRIEKIRQDIEFARRAAARYPDLGSRADRFDDTDAALDWLVDSLAHLQERYPVVCRAYAVEAQERYRLETELSTALARHAQTVEALEQARGIIRRALAGEPWSAFANDGSGRTFEDEARGALAADPSASAK